MLRLGESRCFRLGEERRSWHDLPADSHQRSRGRSPRSSSPRFRPTAHFCYKNSLHRKRQRAWRESQGFATFGELAFEVTGLCPAGIEVLADAAGVTTGDTDHAHAVMASGSAGNKAISHLDFDAIDADIPGRGSRLRVTYRTPARAGRQSSAGR